MRARHPEKQRYRQSDRMGCRARRSPAARFPLKTATGSLLDDVERQWAFKAKRNVETLAFRKVAKGSIVSMQGSRRSRRRTALVGQIRAILRAKTCWDGPYRRHNGSQTEATMPACCLTL